MFVTCVRLATALFLIPLLFPAGSAQALPRFGDAVDAAGARFLRDSDDPHLYHALPSTPRLATDAGGRPRFSLMEFSFRSDDGGTNAGALLNFMLTWGLDAEGQEAAERALRKLDPEARVSSAMIVREGSYRVVVQGEQERWVLAEGKASVMPGQPIAFSRRLDADETERLKAALASEGGVVAAGFLLAVEAMGPVLSARLTIDWDALEQREDLRALRATLRATAVSDDEARRAFDALVKDGVVGVEVMGNMNEMDAALDEAYRRFRDATFETLVGVAPGKGAGKPAIERHYMRRETRMSGHFSLALDGSRSERRQLLITGDITEAIRELGIGSVGDAKAVSTGR